MRRLGAILSALVAGVFLVSLSVFLTLAIRDSGGTMLSLVVGAVGIALSVAATLWIAILEAFFAGVDAKRVTRSLVLSAATLPLLAAALVDLEGMLSRAFLAGGVIALSWAMGQLVLSLHGPERPAGMPVDAVWEWRGWRRAPIARGTVEGRGVCVEYSVAWNGERSEVRTVPCPDAAGLEVTAATMLGGIGGALVKTGDPVFDHHVHVRGPVSAARAMLRAPARAALMELVRGGGRLSGGVLRGDAQTPLRLLTQAAAALDRTGSEPETLRQNAYADPVAEVRLVTLEHLLSLDGPIARSSALAACRAALDDADPRMRVLGIAALAAEREPIRSPANDLLAALRIGAVVAELLDREPPEVVAGALLALLADPRSGADAAPAVHRLLSRTEVESLRSLARQTLDMLEARAADGRGQVSIAAPDPAAGALSATADEAGRVSLPKKQPN